MTFIERLEVIKTLCAVVAAICGLVAVPTALAGLRKLWQVAHSVNGMKEAAERAEYECGQRDEKAAEAKPARKNTHYQRQ